MIAKFLSGNVKGTDHLIYISITWEIRLNFTLDEYCVKVENELSWLGIG
jgi:hypothetical protein